MPVNLNVSERVVTAYLSGEIDHHTARDMRGKIDAAVDKHMPELLVIDFKDVTFMDSSGIGLVMGRYKKIHERHGELRVCGASPQIYKVMRLAGLERLAKIERGGR